MQIYLYDIDMCRYESKMQVYLVRKKKKHQKKTRRKRTFIYIQDEVPCFGKIHGKQYGSYLVQKQLNR